MASSIASDGNLRTQEATRITPFESYSTGFLAIANVCGDGDIEVLAERYLDDEGRDHGQDLTSFFVSLKDKAPRANL